MRQPDQPVRDTEHVTGNDPLAEQLTDLVVGRRASANEGGFPDARATWMVAGLLSSAAGLTAARAGLVPFPGGRNAWPVRVGQLAVLKASTATCTSWTAG